MRRLSAGAWRRWLLPALVLLAIGGCSDSVRDHVALAYALSGRFGATEVTHVTHGDQQRLELSLTGRRWRGVRGVFPDSARAVARYALTQLDEANRPDTIVVRIRTGQGWLGMTTRTIIARFAAVEL